MGGHVFQIFRIRTFVNVDAFVRLHPPSERTPTLVRTIRIHTDFIYITGHIIATWTFFIITWRITRSTFIVVHAEVISQRITVFANARISWNFVNTNCMILTGGARETFIDINTGTGTIVFVTVFACTGEAARSVVTILCLVITNAVNTRAS